MQKMVLTVMAVIVIAAAAASAGVIYSEDFPGDGTNINDTIPDVSATGEAWVAAPIFNQDGSVDPGPGSMTLAFTPQDGAIYTLNASLNGVTAPAADLDWLALGFAQGQSSTAGNYERFTGGNVLGQAWIIFRGDLGSGNLNKTHYAGTGNAADWTALTDLITDVDMRVVLDTTGGFGNWIATWYAKARAGSVYSQVGGPTVLPAMTIDSVGLAASNVDVSGTIGSFSLRDNQATVVYPKEGELIVPAPIDVNLEWVNDQLEPGDPNKIFVDVWFGTDPNKVTGPNNGTYNKVVDAAEEEVSHLAQSLDSGTYYWQIEYYIGDPALGDPCFVEGVVHSFEVSDDEIPTAQIHTENTMTWSDKEVQLSAAVTDDHMLNLLYGWTAEPNGIDDSDLNIEFIPDAATVSPEVKITNTSGSVVTVTLTLTADDGYYDPVSGSVEIDVYTDACDMTKNGMGTAVKQTDPNADCVTDIDDLILLAGEWLEIYLESGPVRK